MDIIFADRPTGDAVALTVFLEGDPRAPHEVFGDAVGDLIARAATAAKFTGKSGEILEVFAPEAGGPERYLLLGFGKREDLTSDTRDAAASALVRHASRGGVRRLSILFSPSGKGPNVDTVARTGMVCRLAAYRYDRFKTVDPKPRQLTSVEVCTLRPADAAERYQSFGGLGDAVNWARDLVNAPANRLRPDVFAATIEETLRPFGLEVERLPQAALETLGFNALLAVGEASTAESQVVVVQWRGGEAGDAPIALVGKGVTFDSGGISLKPGAGMEHMKGDMGGAAAVVGAMRALAARKAPLNVVGVVGLVENMPGGDALRPSDVLTSLSGRTIEVINTDAEGRLVLCDCLTYVQDRFAPKVVVDLATLTGAIVGALGQEYAGLFSNDDGLAQRLCSAGADTGDRLWRLPLAASYDRLIDSSIADVRNQATRGEAGSATAAQFLQRFINPGVKWAHLDIAGVAWMGQPQGEEWATGFGVRLLDRFVGSRAA